MLLLLSNVKSSVIAKFLIENALNQAINSNISDLLIQFVKNVGENVQSTMLTSTYQMVIDENIGFLERYKVLVKIIPNLLRYSVKNVSKTFYSNNVEILLDNFQKSKDFELHIISFGYVEIFFQLFDYEEIEHLMKDINLLSVRSFLCPALEAFKSVNDSPNCRLYKCHAYNTLASIIANFPKFNKLYIKLFIREENGRDILWNSIVDTTKKYHFPVFFDTLSKQRKFVLNLRDELKMNRRKEQGSQHSLKYIASQRLFSSSLSEDVSIFDFTNTLVRAEKTNEEEDNIDNRPHNCRREIVLESTELNNHECMATICGLIQHFFDSGMCILPDENEEIELPDWMIGKWLM